MTHLREGSSLLLWRRDDGVRATAVAVDRDPVVLGPIAPELLPSLAAGDVAPFAAALGAHADLDGPSPGAEDPTLRARLAEQDRMFGGWLPGFLTGEAERIARVEATAARRRVHLAPRLARPTLPISVVRRARAVEALAPRRVVLDDDVDGLALVLAAAGIETVVVEPDPLRRAWLEAEARALGLSPPVLGVISDARSAGECDVAIVAVGPPNETSRALAWACDVVPEGGHVVATLRAPWDEHFFASLPATGLVLTEHLREIDTVMVPGGLVVDGAGDLLVLRRPAEVHIPRPDHGAAARVRQQPYYWLDFDELAGPRLGVEPLARLANLLVAEHGVAEVMRAISRSEGREAVCWFDADGLGLTAQLATEARHLLVTMMPYDLGLEWAVMCAVFHLLGDPLTRVRPQLTTRWRGESIVA